MPLADYSISDLALIAAAILVLGISKGGIPVGPIALQMLVLFWPSRTDPAITAVAFMLPVLCGMDVLAVWFYRKDILWRELTPLLPWSLAGIFTASVLFVASNPYIAISDRLIKACIGVIGLSFVLYQAIRARILRKLETSRSNSRNIAAVTGFSAAFVSTLTHGAGPIFQMYFLPRKHPAVNFAASSAAYFFILNFLKLVPFSLAGRIKPEHGLIMLLVLPLIPVGVAAGYFLTRLTKREHYELLVYAILLFTSSTLIYKAII